MDDSEYVDGNSACVQMEDKEKKKRPESQLGA
jgi:hypothetical protein